VRIGSRKLAVIALIVFVSLGAVYAQKVWELYGRVNGAVGDEIISMHLSGGELWVATTWADPDSEDAPLEGGASLFNAETGNFTTYTPEQGLAHVKIWVMLIDGNLAYFGTPRGVSILDTSKLPDLGPFEVNQAFTTLTKVQGLIEDDVRSIAKDGDTMWFGTNDGMSAYDTKTEEFTNYGSDNLPGKTVHSLRVDGSTIWIGTSSGLGSYDKDSGQFDRIPLPVEGQGKDVVHCIDVDGDEVWIGTRIGIHVYTKSTGEFTTYGDEVLPNTWVNDIVIDDDQVWVATQQGGAAILNRDKNKWKILDEKKGLASNDVREIEPAGEITWFGTLGGLNKYYPAAAAKQAQKYILYGVLVIAAIAAVVVAKLTIFKPSQEEIERKKRDKEARAKRKERKKTGTPSWKICNGVPRTDLCSRCKYNAVKSGKLHCSKYDIDLE